MTGRLFFGDFSFWGCFWQSTVLVAMGLLGSFMLRHRSTRAHQVLLLSMIAAVIVPFAGMFVKHFELGVFVAEPAATQSPAEDRASTSHQIISAESIEARSAPVEGTTAASKASPSDAAFPWRPVVLYGWILASLILAGRLLITFRFGLRLLGRAAPLDCERIERAIHQAKRRLGIDKDVKVCCSRHVRSPVIWCWGRSPVLLVPTEAGQSDIDWTGVLCHELAHSKRRDHISGLLAELAVCILPWQLLLWLVKSRLSHLSELACDDWVIAAGQSGTDYAESLLDLTPGGQMAFMPGVIGSKRGFADRIRRILKDRCGNPRTGGAWILFMSIAVTCLALGLAFAQTRPAEVIRNGETNGDREGQATIATPEMKISIAALSSIEWREREQAAMTLARMEHSAEPAVPALTNALTDEEWQVRKVAAEALASIGPASETAVPALIELLGDEEWHARRAAAEALAAIGPASAPAVPSLIAALDDVEWHVRRRAAEALAAIGTASKPATPHLIAALNDEEWHVRRPAALALGAIGPAAAKAIPTLIERLDDPEWQVRHAVADALEKVSIGDKSAVPEIIEALLDREWKKRQSAALSLQQSLRENQS